MSDPDIVIADGDAEVKGVAALLEPVLSGLIPLVSAAFESKIVRLQGCWEWRGSVMSTGYGRFGPKRKAAHRLAFAFVYGPIPDGLYVCHHCDNRRCVRPDHLFAGSHLDNMRDMVEKGRGRSGAVSLPGESNPAAVLTEREVQIVRRLVGADVSQTVVATAFGVAATTVSDIVRGKKWAKP